MQLVSPLRTRGEVRSFRATAAVASTIVLFALACVALSTFDGSSEKTSELLGAVATTPAAMEHAKGVENKVEEEIAEGKEPNAMDAAVETRGSIPTDAIEASIIVGQNGKDEEANMGKPYGEGPGDLEERGHTNPQGVADAIVDFANDANEDKTGKRGADYYNSVVHDSANPSALTGSLPTYRAESNFITSRVVGNYEKQLENDPAVGLAQDPHANPREVSSLIIDSAVSDSLDCTGSTDKDGIHGPGGHPPCFVPEKFDNHLHDEIEKTIPGQAPTP